MAVSASSPAKKFSFVPTGPVIVAVFGMAQPAASSGASGIVREMGATIEPPTGIAAAGVLQVNGGPNTQPQPAGKGATSVAAGGMRR